MEMEISMSVYRVWDRKYLTKLGERRPEFLLFYGHKVAEPVMETCLSQWYPCVFEVDGVRYTSAEQYMMAEKAKLFGDEEIRAEILGTSDPKKCKSFGRKVKNFNKTVWDQEKRLIVSVGNFEKFMQNDDLRNFLLSTGDKVLVEASPTDRIWGIGLGKNNPYALDPVKWRGENLLGFILMEVRNEIAILDMYGEFDDEEDYEDMEEQNNID